MNSQAAQTTTTADESAIRAFHRQMIDAWNRGSGEGFAAPFSETADFITFEGTHLKGRILGCSLLCHAAGEMISTVQMVRQAQIPYTILRDGVLTHPTMTEGLNLLFSKL